MIRFRVKNTIIYLREVGLAGNRVAANCGGSVWLETGSPQIAEGAIWLETGSPQIAGGQSGWKPSRRKLRGSVWLETESPQIAEGQFGWKPGLAQIAEGQSGWKLTVRNSIVVGPIGNRPKEPFSRSVWLDIEREKFSWGQVGWKLGSMEFTEVSLAENRVWRNPPRQTRKQAPTAMRHVNSILGRTLTS